MEQLCSGTSLSISCVGRDSFSLDKKAVLGGPPVLNDIHSLFRRLGEHS